MRTLEPVSSPEIAFRVCPRCVRAVPLRSEEHFCANDGTRLIDRCPACAAPITSPYARFCVRCGDGLVTEDTAPTSL